MQVEERQPWPASREWYSCMVEMAEKWRNVPLQHICQSSVMITDLQIPDSPGDKARVSMTSDGCAGTINAVNHLEHVQCKVDVAMRALVVTTVV